MVAAGATGLMSASESGSSKEAENITNYRVKNAQRNCESPGKTSVKVEKKNSLRSPSSNKTSISIRETKASRLRAASIVSPTEGSPSDRKSLIASNSSSLNFQTGTCSRKSKSPMSSTGRPTSTSGYREKDKTPKRILGASKCSDIKEKHTSSFHEKIEKTRMRKNSKLESTTSSPSDSRGSGNRLEIRQPDKDSKTTRSSSANPCSSGIVMPRSSIASDNSEVSRRVDALTALTRATMERVERLSRRANPSSSSTKNNITESKESKPSEISISIETTSRQQIPPISILKHKTIESESLPSTEIFPSLIVQQFTKKHGILKKRCSLDDNEILRRRRSCSPDTVNIENNAVGYKPILLNVRRSSLDELVKRSRSPDQLSSHSQPQHPTSILKRKSSGEDEREEGQSVSTEPTSILKRSSGSNGKPVVNHVSIVAAVAKTLGYTTDNINGSSEVRPILKKKYSREEYSSSETTSLEPRPILKKKSSTDSDEHDEKPKKTILKCSRKSSQEDSGNEIDGASPKKLSMLKNRSIQRRTNSLPECDVVRPILKQCSPRESSSPSRSSLSGTASPGDEINDVISKNLFLRKRARSVGHLQSSMNGREDWLEVEDSCRQENHEKSEKFIDPSSPGQNITWLNESTATAITNTTASATTTTTTTATTSSIASVVSFKLSSRQETTRHRYETRAERSLRDDREQPIIERKTNVSQIAQRFKSLEEQITIPTTTRQKHRKYSNESPKYERFNTQPVTYEEVKEAVLHNQRNAAVGKILTNHEQSNEIDPCKLSLADRVHMFNERIATESIAKVGTYMERSQRRRPSNRYKTQPITSEEVEVAARNFPSEEIAEPHVSRVTISHSREAFQNDNVVQPRSILKYCQPVGDNFTETVDSCSRRLRSSRSACVTTFVTNSSGSREVRDTDFQERNIDSEELKMINLPNTSIADRLAALERSGTSDWKRRVNAEALPAYSSSNKQSIDNVDKDEASTRQQKLAERLEKLESAAEGWRKRVAAPDAVKFSVAGKMMGNRLQVDNLQIDRQLQSDGRRKMPNPERFRGNKSSAVKTITSSREDSVIQEVSLERNNEEKGDGSISTNEKRSIWEVPRADDETFTSFFSNISLAKCEAETLDVAESDFDVVTSFSERLGTRRTTKTQRRRLQSKNPLRTLAARTDLKNEYTEMTTGVAERVMKSLNLEKLGKNSSLAVEALAGLASSEDFSSVTLKNVDTDSTGYGNSLPPYKDIMLILIKGRRHVQVRLVEPVASSINSGDNYILVTKNQLYNYVGKYSNVIERARGAEIALSIQQNKDLGCRASQVITVSEEKVTCSNDDIVNFWKILGVESVAEVTDGGHPDEDELYESALTETNMIYEVVGEYELLPIEKYWGALPKIEMLDPSKILVFDFGSEMYIWNGKIAPSEKRKVATLLAEELWREGYDYSECTVSPIDSASIIGRRKNLENNEKKAAERPKWCMIAKLTQHMETILFREKFLDWPNVTGILRVKKENEKEQVDGKVIVEPPQVDDIIDSKSPVVDLVLEGSHLGRGSGWYDDELMRQSVVSTTNVTVWHIDEYSYSLLDASSIGQFYTGDSYIVRWMYTITNTGRGLDGEPSRHLAKGRDRCAYFIWQGQKASLNEKGTAALLTVELDQEQGPQIRVVEGFEPAAFLNLFSGKMIVHMGKRSKKIDNQRWRLYTYRGSEKSEICLIQVPRSSRQLRSRGALLLIDGTLGEIYVWYGHAAIDNIKQNIMIAAQLLKDNRPEEVGLSRHENVTIHRLNESVEEPAIFYQGMRKKYVDALGGMNKQLYASLNESGNLVYTPRLFRLSSVSGEFAATELLCPHRTHGTSMPFPFLQDELYQVNQPALFLLDNKDELWLWQGWWPDGRSEDQTGSGAVRWQGERRAAMVMAVRYWKKRNPGSNKCPVYLAWAGLEPLAFTNLFPTWTLYDEIAELNIKDGRDPGQVLKVEGELARLTQSTYPPAELLQRPLPEGVDPTILEQYLSPQHFEELLGMNIEEYEQLPAWKQRNIKKKIGLF